jgi:hypothetical protein
MTAPGVHQQKGFDHCVTRVAVMCCILKLEGMLEGILVLVLVV